MRVVYKYPIPAWFIEIDTINFEPSFSLQLPKHAKVLEMGLQNNEFFIWAFVDPSAPMEERKFVFFGTGTEVQNAAHLRYISSWVSSLVFHLFEDIKMKDGGPSYGDLCETCFKPLTDHEIEYLMFKHEECY